VIGVFPACAQIALGDRVWLIPGHCDPTVKRYDWIVGMRGEPAWLLAARGMAG
jgi:3-hydroxy-D-aspartate aldolase